jgi:hypothetical protein
MRSGTLIPIVTRGDFNNDGTVDAADYVLWRNGLGTTYTRNDYELWRAQFGASPGPGSGSSLANAESLPAAIPEPAAAMFAHAAAAFFFISRRGGAAKNYC